jgi:RHS repeat-associated protein
MVHARRLRRSARQNRAHSTQVQCKECPRRSRIPTKWLASAIATSGLPRPRCRRPRAVMSATRLVRFGAREYDAEIGRWLAKDPSRFNGVDADLCEYVGGGVSSQFDPMGLHDARLSDETAHPSRSRNNATNDAQPPLGRDLVSVVDRLLESTHDQAAPETVVHPSETCSLVGSTTCNQGMDALSLQLYEARSKKQAGSM